MTDWGRLEGFEWDAGNARKSELRHDVSMGEAEQLFLNAPLLVLENVVHSSTKTRWPALGHTDASRLLHVTFTLRAGGTLIRVIFARRMHRNERSLYGPSR